MSVYCRDQILNYMQTNLPSENILDMSAMYQELKEFLADNGVMPEGDFVGVEFHDGIIQPVAIASDATNGLYRELGTMMIHVAKYAELGVAQNIPQRGEAFVKLFGLGNKRIGTNNDIVIDQLVGIATGVGATLDFDGGYVAGTIRVSYYRDVTRVQDF